MVFFRCRVRGISTSVFFLIVLLLLVYSPITANAAEVVVCRNSACTDDEGRTIYSTFESALTALSGGGTIIVKRGSSDPIDSFYLPTSINGNLGFGNKIIHLKKDDAETAECIILGTDTSKSTIWIQAGDAPGSKIEGFTIIGNRGTNTGNGGAMSIRQKVVVENCVLRNSSSELGGAVYIAEPNVKPIFKKCIFRSNSASEGGAVYILGDGRLAPLYPDNPPLPIFHNCLFTGNNATDTGDAFHIAAGNATIVNCTLAGNDSSDALIHYQKSLVPLQITNSILLADAGDDALVSTNGNLEASEASFINTYIRGSYEYLEGAVKFVYEPSRVLVRHVDGGSAEYMSYTSAENDFVYTVSNQFNPTFVDTTLYHLNRNSSFIGLGLNYVGDDFEGDARPYELSPGPDLGWDEFNFCYLVNNNIGLGSSWYDIGDDFDVITADGTLPADPMLSGESVTTWFQNGKVKYYRIIVPDLGARQSGVMRIWSTASGVDLQGILYRGCDQQELIATDGKNGTWLNFHIDYPYAVEGEDYYLAVHNQSKDNSGTFNLYGVIQTDDYANTCTVADSEAVTSFSDTYFNLNDADKVKPIPSSGLGDIDFVEDEDVFRLEFSGQGTLVITSQMVNDTAVAQTTPQYIEASIKVKNADGTCDVVAEQRGTGSITLIYQNASGNPCYLNVKKNLGSDADIVQYGFDAVYYPIDNEDGIQIALGSSTNGFITYPGDKDLFTFVVPEGQAGIITANTSGCDVDSRLDIYNALHEKIEDNGALSGHNYIINKARADDLEYDFFVTAGTYYIRVAPFADYTAPFSYTLNLTYSPENVDEHAGIWILGTIVYPWKDSPRMTDDPELYYETVESAIDSSSEKDVFRIDVPYNAKLDVMVNAANSSRAIMAELLDSRGEALVTDSDIRTSNPACQTDGSATGIYAEVEKGKYYIRLSSGGSTNYVLSVDLDDFPDEPSSSKELKNEWVYNRLVGHIETTTPSCGSLDYDKDIFRLEVQSENQYRIYTTGDSNTYGRLYKCTDSTCSSWSDYPGWSTYARQNYDGNNFVIGIDPSIIDPDPDAVPSNINLYGINLEQGTYAVEVRMETPATDTGEYTVHFIQLDDYCNDNTCAVYPPVGVLNPQPHTGTKETQTGVIEIPGDIDYFKCVPATDGRLVLEEPLNHKPDLIFKLLDANNNRLTYSSSGSLEFDVSGGETYYVSVNPVYALNTGDYSFTYIVNTGLSEDDDGANDGEGNPTPGNNFAQARLLNPDNFLITPEHSGQIDLEGDYDYYYFTVNGEGALRIFSGGSTDTYGYLFLEDNNMYNLVMSDDDSGDGRNFEINYYVVGTGDHTYYLKVRGYSPTETGAYTLYINFDDNLAADDHGDECESATPVSLNTGVLENGHIVFNNSQIGIPGDNDNFRLVAGPDSGGNISFNAYTRDSDVDTFGYLKDLVCGTLALNDNGSDPSDGWNFRLAYALTGTPENPLIPCVYHVLARSYYGTDTGTYDFHVESNGSFVEPVDTTQIYIANSESHYVAFNAPGNISYLNTSTTSGSVNVSQLKGTFLDGNGYVLEREINTADGDSFELMKDMLLADDIYIAGLERGLHFLKIDNAGGAGTFDLTLNCSPYGSIGYGDAEGSFTMNQQTFTVTADGSGFSGSSDNGYLVYKTLDKGFEFIARVTFLSGRQTDSRGGLMVRENYAINQAQARYVFSGLRYNSNYYATTQLRETSGGSATSPVNISIGNTSSCYVRLHYGGNGSSIVTNYSTDGRSWSSDYIAPVHLVPPLNVGYAVSSDVNGSNLTTQFSNIQYIELELGEE